VVSASHQIAAILEVLHSITPHNARSGQLNYYVVSDTERHHYQLFVSGCQQHKRVHGIVVQTDIRDGLIWVQEDGTDVGVAS
jgi:predicted secreted Zn-dependent protease